MKPAYEARQGPALRHRCYGYYMTPNRYRFFLGYEQILHPLCPSKHGGSPPYAGAKGAGGSRSAVNPRPGVALGPPLDGSEAQHSRMHRWVPIAANDPHATRVLAAPGGLHVPGRHTCSAATRRQTLHPRLVQCTGALRTNSTHMRMHRSIHTIAVATIHTVRSASDSSHGSQIQPPSGYRRVHKHPATGPRIPQWVALGAA